MERFEQYLKTKVRPTTSDRYVRAVRIFQAARGEEGASTARYKDITAHLGALREQGLGPDHLAVELAGLKAYFKFLVATGERVDDPTRHVFIKDANTHKPIQFQDLFTKEEMDLLLDRPNRYELLQWRNKLIVSLYIYQGLTTGEIVALTTKDIDLDKGNVFVKPSPKQCSRSLPLKANQVMFIERYLTFDRPQLSRQETDALFLSKLGTPAKGEDAQYLIESARELFPTRTLNPQTIWQSVLVNLFRQSWDVRDVQLFAGHHYASTTERYMPTDLSKLQGALERFHPMG